ncbi:MAG TPA: O-antigen ligase family protein [Thermoanaerobaculia bacterium]|nr:O-antigen ligase family protein [Thermoanaerobaculia bacterium]
MRPSPLGGLLGAAGWIALAAFLTPLLVPPIPAYRSAVVAAAVILLAVSLVARSAAFVAALLVVTGAGVSAFLFGAGNPAIVAPIALAGYFAGLSLAGIYEMGAKTEGAPLVSLFRAWGAAAAASALSAVVAARTGYLLLRHVPPPRTVNVGGEDASQAITGILAVLASLAVAVGLHRATARLSRDERGRRAVDVALVLSALLAGTVALLQKLGAVPIFRAPHWGEWNRAQATFSDPSAAGVAAALLVAPLLARAAAGRAGFRLASLAAVALVLPIVADAGSRAGLVGTLTAAAVFLIWDLTRVAAGARPGMRRRVVSAVGVVTLIAAFAFAAALSWPNRGAVRSALLARLDTTFEKRPTPAEKTPERLLLYEGALAIFREHPVVGIGLGGFKTEFPNAAAETLLRPVKWTDNPPSLYLGSLSETGLAGSVLLVLLLTGVVRAIGSGLAFRETNLEEALRAAGAAAAVVGLLAVFLFGSHLVYPEVAALFGVLTARLPLAPEGRTSRLLSALMPAMLAGALVLLFGGVLARLYETRTPEAAFARGETAGIYPTELEPDGRPFRWTAEAAAWRIGGQTSEEPRRALRVRPHVLELPLRNARPDGRPVWLDVFWDDKLRGRVRVPSGRWQRLELAIDGPGILRLETADWFRPLARGDRRRLGVEVGPEPLLVPRARVRAP